MQKVVTHVCLLFLLLVVNQIIFAQQQVQLYIDNFENGDAFYNLNAPDGIGSNIGPNKWIINNDYTGQGSCPNTTTQDNTVSGQIEGAPKSKYLHIYNDNSTNKNCCHDGLVASDNFTYMKQGICTIGATDLILVFFYIAGGSNNDYGEVYYSANGNPWIKTGQTLYANQNIWKYEVIDNFNFLNVEDLRFGFRWINDSNNNGDPVSFGIDDMQIVATYDDINPLTVNVTAIDESICEGTNLLFTFALSDTLCDGNYTIELSDATGSFNNPLAQWGATLLYPDVEFTFALTMPNFVIPGNCYKIRINRNFPLPAIIGEASACFIIENCPNTITTLQPAVTLDTNAVCIGSVIDIPFFSTGVFNSSNSYIATLSNPDGNFSGGTKLLGTFPSGKTYDPLLGSPPGSVGGLIPSSAVPGCNYFIRITSNSPSTIGSVWGPFCIQECDISTNGWVDVQVCLFGNDGADIDITIEMNEYNTDAVYGENNQFLAQVLSSMDFSEVNLGAIGVTISQFNDLMTLHIPKLADLAAIGMKPGLWYLRVIATDSNLPDNALGTVIRLTIGAPSADPLIIVPGSQAVCGGTNPQTIYFFVEGQNPESQYHWFFGTDPIPPPYSPSPVLGVTFNSQPGTQVTIRVQEENYGCLGMLSPPVIIDVIGPPQTTISGPPVVCEDEVYTFQVPYIPATYYNWSITNGEIVDTGNNVVSVKFFDGGSATLSVNALNLCGSGNNSITVNVIPSPPVTAITTDDKICLGDGTTIFADFGPEIINTKWFINDSLISDQIALYITPTQSTDYIFYGDDGMCGNYDTIHIEVINTPAINIIGDTAYCSNQETLLTQTGGIFDSIKWSTNETTTTIKPTQTNNYTVTGYFDECSASTTTHVSIYEQPNANPSSISICENKSALLDAQNPGMQYLWSNNQTSQTIEVNTPGIYLVTVTNAICTSTASAAVTQQFLPVVKLGSDTAICSNDKITLNAQNQGMTYLWSTGETTQTIKPSTTNTYAVTVSNNCGAISDSTFVDVQYCDCSIVVPNAFSPNKDGVNDLFKVFYSCEVSNFKCMIYNRWGQKVFETSDINTSWDGTFENKPANIGVYVWVIQYHKKQGLKEANETQKGNVTLIY